MARRPELVITSGPMSGRRFEVGPGGMRMGRSSTNDVYIPDEGLSRNHCLFEQVGECGIRVTDLASANGTYVNGESLGTESRDLKPGDRIEAGTTVVEVVGGDAPASAPAAPGVSGDKVDLGLGGARKKAAAPSAPTKTGQSRPRFALANILWVAAACAMVAAIGVVLFVPRGEEEEKPSGTPDAEAQPKPDARLVSLFYEKIEATPSRVFRYEVTLDESGTMRVSHEDVPEANRHFSKGDRLDKESIEELEKILAAPALATLEGEYTGQSVADENGLKRFRIRIVRRNGVKDVMFENTTVKDGFREVCEAVEGFSYRKLGVSGLQYSRDELLKRGRESMSVGDSKWDEREAAPGNLSASVKAYEDAKFYVETLNPKPEWYEGMLERLAQSKAELKRRFEEMNFWVEQAEHGEDQKEALRRLGELFKLVPNEADPRNREVRERILAVEGRIEKAKRNRRK